MPREVKELQDALIAQSVASKVTLTGTSQLANTKQAMNLPDNHLIDFPSGKRGFTGRVDVRLGLVHGMTLTDVV